MTRRFILFAGQCYYASGGLHDVAGSFDTLAEAVAYATRKTDRPPPLAPENVYEWYHVLDSESMSVVASSEDQPYGAPRFPPEIS